MKLRTTLALLLCFALSSSLAQRGLALGERDSLWNVWSDPNEADTTRLKAIQRIAWHGYLFSKPDSAFHFAQLQYDFAEEKALLKPMSSALNIQATALNFQGDFERALTYYDRSLQIGREIDDLQGVAVCLNNMGNIYKNQGHFAKAIDYFFESLKIREEIGDTLGIASSSGNIANVYRTQGENLEALNYYLRCLSIMEDLQNKQGIAGTLNNIGLVYEELGDHDKALETHLRSLRMREEMGDQRGIADSYTNLGNLYFSDKDFENAVGSHSKSLAIREAAGDRKGVASSMYNLGKIEAAKSSHTQALAYGNNALTLAQQVGDVEVIRDISKLLYKSYKATNRHQQALEMHELHVSMRDSVLREENQRELMRQQFRYDFDKREAKLKAEQDKKDALSRETLLQQRAQRNLMVLGFLIVLIIGGGSGTFLYQRKKSQYRLRSVLLELKAVKAQISPHFFFNALNSVVNMITDKRSEEAEAFLVKYSRLMRHTLRDSERELVTLEEEIAVLTNYLELEAIRLPGRFTYHFEVDDTIDPAEVLIPSMLVQPLVENAVWHGVTPLDHGGEIRIGFQKSGSSLKVSVQDNGIGRSGERTTSSDPAGSSITAQRIALYNDRYRMKGELILTDMSPGLRAEFNVPLIKE